MNRPGMSGDSISLARMESCQVVGRGGTRWKLRERATLNAGDQPPAEIPHQKVSGHPGAVQAAYDGGQ